MSHRICLCPASIAWIRRHLKKSARATFTRLIKKGSIAKLTRRRKGRRRSKSRKRPRFTPRVKSFGKKRPTAKQIRARKLFVMRVRRGDFR